MAEPKSGRRDHGGRERRSTFTIYQGKIGEMFGDRG
jgi:hypothetical protein